MLVLRKKVDQDLCDAIQARQIELEGAKNLIAYCLAQTEYNIPQSKIEDLRKEYNRIFKEYELLKGQLESTFIDEVDPSKTSWNLDFESAEVVITVND